MNSNNNNYRAIIFNIILMISALSYQHQIANPCSKIVFIRVISIILLPNNSKYNPVPRVS